MILWISEKKYLSQTRAIKFLGKDECSKCRGAGYYSEEFNDLQCDRCNGDGELYLVEVPEPDIDQEEGS